MHKVRSHYVSILISHSSADVKTTVGISCAPLKKEIFLIPLILIFKSDHFSNTVPIRESDVFRMVVGGIDTNAIIIFFHLPNTF